MSEQRAKLRVGRKVGRTIYAQAGTEPSDDDVLVGTVDTPDLATAIVTAHNFFVESPENLVIPISTLSGISATNAKLQADLTAMREALEAIANHAVEVTAEVDDADERGEWITEEEAIANFARRALPSHPNQESDPAEHGGRDA